MIVTALSILPSGLLGQDVAALEQRIESLEQEVAAAKRDEDSLKAIYREREIAKFETVTVGGFRLLTHQQLRNPVEAAGELAWSAVKEMFQDSIAQLVRQTPFAVLPEMSRDTLRNTIIWYPESTTLVFAPVSDRERGLAGLLVSQVYQRLWQLFDSDLKRWMSSPPPVLVGSNPNRLEGAYFDLATSSSPAAQRCLIAAEACREALGLFRPSDPAAAWYSPLGRRDLTVRLTQTLKIGENRVVFDRCVAGSDHECLTLLRSVPELIPSPLAASTRAGFLRFALEQGGPGSFPALLAGVGQPMEVRLVAASSMPVEKLLADWHRRVIESRPAPTGLQSGQALATTAWMLVLLTVALRSSRWR